jgi:hypothetical protein
MSGGPRHSALPNLLRRQQHMDIAKKAETETDNRSKSRPSALPWLA